MTTVTLADWKPTKNQIKLVNEVLKSGRLTYGPMTRKLEEDFAKLHGKKYAIFTNSGTSSLQVAWHYLKEKYHWKDGDEVIVPAVTFVATVNVILQNKLKPVLVDIDPNTYNIDVSMIERAITEKTRAICPVDLLGQTCDMARIREIADEYDLKVVEDSCETMFVKQKGKVVGSRADIACYSSYLAHIISTGVGGFTTTDDKEAADAMRSMIWHGRDSLYLSIDANRTIPPEQLIHARFKFNRAGYSYRLTEMEAALGIDELARSKEIVKARQANAKYLTKKLAGLEPKIQLPYVAIGADNCWMFYPIVVHEGSRDEFALFLEKKGIQTRWIMPLTNQPVYKKLFKEEDYPEAEYLNNNGLLVGCHHFLEKKDLDYLSEMIHEYFSNW